MKESGKSLPNPYLSDNDPSRRVELRNARLKAGMSGTIAVAALGTLIYWHGDTVYRWLTLEPEFNPDQCGEGLPTPGKGGNSAVYHAFESMEPDVVASGQTIADLGKQANQLYGGTMDIGDSVRVCVDLDSGVAKVTKPLGTE